LDTHYALAVKNAPKDHDELMKRMKMDGAKLRALGLWN
jgi:hypothetical protein